MPTPESFSENFTEGKSRRTRLTSAQLPGASTLVDIDVENGRIVDIRSIASQRTGSDVASASNSLPEDHVEDLDGMLLVPSLREHHAHLDKALTADGIVNRTGDLMGAIQAWVEAEASGVLGLEEMQMRAESALERMLHCGVTSVRTHVNVGESDPTFRSLRAVSAARDRFLGLVDVEIVALMQSPLAGSAGRGNRRALDQAIEFGIDLIGGCPHLEADSQGMISHVLDSAEAAALDVDLHVDESLEPDMLTIELLAQEVVRRGCLRRVTASHCVSLSVQSMERQVSIARLLREAQIAVIALPQTNLFLQGWNHPQSMPRGIAPVKLLLEQGVSVAAGGDNVQDPFNPVGRFDPLETASLLVIASHVDPSDALRVVSTDPRKFEDPLQDLIGAPADFLAIDGTNIREAIASASATRRTVRGGHVVAMTTVEKRVIPFEASPPN
ncbi:MAG: amidohydrolase family protein [Actinomycetota bacterium]